MYNFHVWVCISILKTVDILRNDEMILVKRDDAGDKPSKDPSVNSSKFCYYRNSEQQWDEASAMLCPGLRNIGRKRTNLCTEDPVP